MSAPDPLQAAGEAFARAVLWPMHPTVPPEDAAPGDLCALVLADGTICEGTLQCWVDVRGAVPDCHCHISPPCGACLEAPLVCNRCDETVP